LRDAQAASASGCIPHLVLTGKGEQFVGQALPDTFPSQTRIHTDLAAFADWMLTHAVAKNSNYATAGSS
jgi:D-glycero-D-manno-heptose 1,7-bisphosphate phosphatase